MASAALLFLVIIATVNGDCPFLSLKDKSTSLQDNISEMIPVCWFKIATWSGVFPSTSYHIISTKNSIVVEAPVTTILVYIGKLTWTLTLAWCSNSVQTTFSKPQAQAKCSGVCKSNASSPPLPSGPGRRGLLISHPLQHARYFIVITFLCNIRQQPFNLPANQEASHAFIILIDGFEQKCLFTTFRPWTPTI